MKTSRIATMCIVALTMIIGCSDADEPPKNNMTMNNANNLNNLNNPNNTNNLNNPNNTNNLNNPNNPNNPNNTAPCGNGVLDDGELCDPAIAAGEPGACPTSCQGVDACTPSTLVGDPMACTATCEETSINACSAGDGCCPDQCDATTDSDCMPECGNGVLEGDEICDGDCPQSCNDGMSCTADTLTGSPDTCDAVCANDPITACTAGDGCCPDGCDETTDADCGAVCPNGIVESGEICDGNCPATCDDQDACTTNQRVGSDDMCNVECVFDAITACTNDDGCCAPGCNANNDNDCSPICDNGVVEAGETCDQNCPTTCDDQNACTDDALTGSAANCDVVCESTPISTCTDDDGCCAPGCNANNDNDCSASCGNAVVESGETCDGNCPSSCDDQNSCTTDTQTGSAGNCNVACNNTPISVCSGGDGCCPAGCNANNDSDCSATCGNSTVEPGETCDGSCPTTCSDGFACTTDTLTGSSANCNVQCSFTEISACVDGDGCCAQGCTPADDSDCSGTGATGDSCTSGGQCASGGCLDEPTSGGYCTELCVQDSDCGTGAHCGFIADDGIGICLDDCSTNLDCRTPDYECYNGDFDANGVDECWSVGSGTGAVGEACTLDADCGGGQLGYCIGDGQGWQNGYCSRQCNTTNPCPSGSHCTDDAGGVCLDSCQTNSDCRAEGYLCIEADGNTANGKECAPAATGTGAVGDACDEDYECSGGVSGFCIDQSEFELRNGYCSFDCDTANDQCPAGSHCVSTDSTSTAGVCFADCQTDTDCRGDGFACYDLDGDTTDECWRSATGAGTVGDACNGYWECAGGTNGTCNTNFPGGYCTTFCGTGGQACGTGETCWEPTAGDGGNCLATCGTASDCRPDYLCETPQGATENACFL